MPDVDCCEAVDVAVTELADFDSADEELADVDALAEETAVCDCAANELAALETVLDSCEDARFVITKTTTMMQIAIMTTTIPMMAFFGRGGLPGDGWFPAWGDNGLPHPGQKFESSGIGEPQCWQYMKMLLVWLAVTSHREAIRFECW